MTEERKKKEPHLISENEYWEEYKKNPEFQFRKDKGEFF